MDVLAYVLLFVVDVMKIPFTVWGFTLSLWEIMLYGLIALIVLSLIVGYFDGD